MSFIHSYIHTCIHAYIHTYGEIPDARQHEALLRVLCFIYTHIWSWDLDNSLMRVIATSLNLRVASSSGFSSPGAPSSSLRRAAGHVERKSARERASERARARVRERARERERERRGGAEREGQRERERERERDESAVSSRRGSCVWRTRTSIALCVRTSRAR